MENIHVLPTDKPSRLCINGKNGQHIYITSDEEIKEGDWVITPTNDIIQWAKVFQPDGKKIVLTTDQDLIKDGVQAIDDEFLKWFVKNPSCEWVDVKSEILYEHKDTYRPYPSECKNLTKTKVNYYLSIIPKEEAYERTTQSISLSEVDKQEDCSCTDECLGYLTKSCKRIEEPKQETLEEAKQKILDSNYMNKNDADIFEMGVKWQQEQDKNKYSEEEARAIWSAGQEYWRTSGDSITFEELTEKFKNK